MPTLTLTLTADQYTVLAWAADQRRTPLDILVAETLASILAPLEVHFREAHRDEAAKLFLTLPLSTQSDILATIKTASGGK